MSLGLRESRGRWEACIEEGSRQAKLLFASEEEAAKAYDKLVLVIFHCQVFLCTVLQLQMTGQFCFRIR